jgi:hypothetical protein
VTHTKDPRPLSLLLAAMLLAVMGCSGAVLAQETSPSVAPEAAPQEESLGPGFYGSSAEEERQKYGSFLWFSLVSTAPGHYVRSIYQTAYTHPSDGGEIEPSLGTFLAPVRVATFGVVIAGRHATLQGSLGPVGAVMVGVPGHREVTGGLGVLPFSAALAVRPLLSLPLALEGRGDVLWSPGDAETVSGDEKEQVPMGLLMASGELHVKWEVSARRFTGLPLLELGAGVRYQYLDGEFRPDGTFPGLRFRSEQWMFGGELSSSLPLGSIRGLSNRKPARFPVGLFSKLGFYAGTDGQFTVIALLDLRFFLP